MLSNLRKGFTIFKRRLREQGISTTLLWIYGRVIPWVTGKPLLQFCEVTPQLYVGPQYRSNGLEFLRKSGIHAVVNMRIEKDDAKLGLAPAQYCYLPTVDDEAPSFMHLQQGVEFIGRVIQDGGKVYIHCGAGVGRAPTMAAAYLISNGKRLPEALQMIKKARPFIAITSPQMKALRAFEEHYNHHSK
jgi:protein tyrosine phosphatase (PTP) superfamily phosphohydrolase (DUF442 family)